MGLRWLRVGVLPALLAAGLGCGWTQILTSSESDWPGVKAGLRLTEVDAAPRVRLAGNVRPEATAANDLGEVEDGLRLEHVQLLLRRSPEREAALETYLAGLSDRSSGNYHRWLTAAAFGERFGVGAGDFALVTGWLELHGLVVNAVYPSRVLVDFSGTAAAVREAFGTEIHAYEVDGVRHVANAADPWIPGPLSGVVAGVVSLHDFGPRAMLVTRALRGREALRGLGAQFTSGSGSGATYPVTPADLAVIYNFAPLFKAGITGTGQTIAVVEDSDVYSAADWTAFRAAFGLSEYTTGSFKQVHPALVKGTNNCADPGAKTGWDEEPILDAEYATASAPGAAVEVASCANTAATNGNVIALANLVNGTALPSVISVSFGNCEAGNGATANAAINAAYQQAAAEGISVFVAAGDGGSAFCDVGATAALHGIGVNAYASSPYDVAVGGTDFSDTYSKTNSTYWKTSNSTAGGSAKSYIPEAPWNDSCANPLIAAWNGYKSTYGSAGFCAWDALTFDAYQTTIAGSGGPSGCATGAASTAFTVSGGCKGYAKPVWQAASGVPADGVRDLPDVSLFAGDGIWGHSFLFCDSNLNDDDGAVCTASDVAEWSEGGGTSFAAPLMAGMQALVNQKWGRQGNPNPVYYKMAAAQFVSSTLKTACNSTLGASSSTSCVFHDVTQGASAVNCVGTKNCYVEVLSTSSLVYASAYGAGTGWDFASGLGSVNAYNLVMSSAW